MAALPASAGGADLFDVRSAFVPAGGTVTAVLGGTIYQVEARREPGDYGDRDLIDGAARLSVAHGGWLELTGRFDAAFFSNDSATVASYRDGFVGAQAELPLHAKWLHAGVAGGTTLPWGRRGRGYSSGTFDPSAALLLTVPLPESSPRSSTSLHVNVGYRWRGDSRGSGYEGLPAYYLEPVYPQGDNDRIDLRAALEFRARSIAVFVEAVLDQIVSDDLSFRESPIFVTPGFRLSLSERVSLRLGSKITLSSDDESTTRFRPPEEMFPDWQIAFALTWTTERRDADRDADGVPDHRDRCPLLPEDLDGVADQDGCPETDFDGDGIPDEMDPCPLEAEDFDGDSDLDGCPEEDPAPVEAPEGDAGDDGSPGDGAADPEAGAGG